MKLFLGAVCLSLIMFASAVYSPSDDVVELTAANFNKLVIQGDELWIVEFYAPWCGHCQSLAPEYKKAATALSGVVKVGAVNMDEHQSVGGPYNVRGFPTIKVFGSNKNQPEDYNGPRTAQGIADAAMSHLKNMVNARMSGGYKSSGGGSRSGGSGGGGKQGSGGAGNAADVIELTDGNFEELVINSDDMWLVEFFAPWCGHCKNLAPHWQSAATELKGRVKMGALDATVHTIVASRYGVRGYPTIKYFPAGKKSQDSAEDYDGGRTSGDIVNWASDKAVDNIPPPEVNELYEEDSLKNTCEDKQLCVISILPHILDCQSECRNKYIQILKDMGEKYKKKMWGWAWAEGAAQPAVEETFGIGGFGYPALAVLNSRKMKYALLKGPFSETGINEFLRELSFGRGSTLPVANAQLPKVEAKDPWDGKDGELPVEEEYDLSDVELDDLDDDKKDEL